MNTPNSIPVLAKAIVVMQTIARSPASASQLSQTLRIAPATCYRILKTCESAGWIKRAADGNFHLAGGLVELAAHHAPHRRLISVAEPLLEELSRELELASKLSVRVGDQAMTVARADSPAHTSVGGTTGARFHVCIGSSGAALLTGLSSHELSRLAKSEVPGIWDRQTPADFRARVRQVKAEGYCVDRGSFHANVHTVSVPLIENGQVMAAITVLAFPSELPPSRVQIVKSALLDTQRACNKQLSSESLKDLS